MSQHYPFRPSPSEEGQKPQPTKRKLLPQKMTFADIFEDEPPTCKKSRKQLDTTSVSITKKKILKPMRMTINPEDLEDTPPVCKSKRKGDGAKRNSFSRKTILHSKVNFSRANGTPSEWRQKPQPTKRKLLPQKMTFADIFEDDPPTCIKQLDTTSISTTKKKILKPMRMIINPEDLEDTPPVCKSKRKGDGAKRNSFSRKTVVPSKVNFSRANGFSDSKAIFVKPKKKQAVKTIRKELFSGTKSPLQQIPELNSNSRKISCTPLVKVNDIEIELLKNPHAFQQLQSSRVVFNKVESVRTTKAKLDFENSSEITKNEYNFPASAASVSATKSNNFLTTGDISTAITEGENFPLNISNLSPDENEFIENERKCKSANNQSNSSLNLSSYTKKYTALNGYTSKESDHVFKLHERFNKLQRKLISFVNEFQEEMKSLQEDIESYQDTNKVIEVLDGEKENFVVNKEWHITSTVKKNVTFNLKAEDRTVDDFSSQDVGLEKSVLLYNSLRKGCDTVLNTPKMNRTCLQTPKRVCTNQKEAVSRKVQKQCLLLLDTPVNKTRKNL